jgi:Protein of unknown function (DUF2934)
MKNGGSALPVATQPSLEEIAVRAYELYLERGATDGGDVADWLEAERQLNGIAESPAAETRPRLVRTTRARGTKASNAPSPTAA